MVNERDALSYIQLLKRRIFKHRQHDQEESEGFSSHSMSETVSEVLDPAASTNYLGSEEPEI